MTINNLNLSGIATSVWASATRTLTAFGGAIAFPSLGASIPASTSASIHPVSGSAWLVSICVTAGAGGSVTVNLTDGVSITGLYDTVLAGTSKGYQMTLNNNVFLSLVNNDAVNSASYVYTALLFWNH